MKRYADGAGAETKKEKFIAIRVNVYGTRDKF